MIRVNYIYYVDENGVTMMWICRKCVKNRIENEVKNR